MIPNRDSEGESPAKLGKFLGTLDYLLTVFKIESLMAYGGEPLLFPTAVTSIFRAATTKGVGKRELITSGYFSNDSAFINYVAEQLIAAGVNDVKISVDAFHQEHIPVQRIDPFIAALKANKFKNILLHPAWLVSQDADNYYNRETRRLLEVISRTYDIKISRGNTITLSGLAKKYLWNYFPEQTIDLATTCGTIAHTNSLSDVKTLRILANGNIAICRAIVIGNIFRSSIESIIQDYDPNTHEGISLLLAGGLSRLLSVAEKHTGRIDLTVYRNPCDLCADCIKAISDHSN